jgi:hypothetical protein
MMPMDELEKQAHEKEKIDNESDKIIIMNPEKLFKEINYTAKRVHGSTTIDLKTPDILALFSAQILQLYKSSERQTECIKRYTIWLFVLTVFIALLTVCTITLQLTQIPDKLKQEKQGKYFSTEQAKQNNNIQQSNKIDTNKINNNK